MSPEYLALNWQCDLLGQALTHGVCPCLSPQGVTWMLRTLHVPVVVGCVLSLLVLLYSSAVLLLHCWRRPSAPASLQLQGALVLAAAVTVFMVSARDGQQVIAACPLDELGSSSTHFFLQLK